MKLLQERKFLLMLSQNTFLIDAISPNLTPQTTGQLCGFSKLLLRSLFIAGNRPNLFPGICPEPWEN